MNFLQQFVEFLLNQKPKRSWLTVKNYKADIGQFINWFEKEFNLIFDPTKITPEILQQYRKARNLSASSIERHMSSLRKFFNFLKNQGITSQNPLKKLAVSTEALAKVDPWMIRNFKSHLYESKKSDLTIKNYINDIRSFFFWLEEVALVKYAWNTADKNLLSKINFPTLEEYKQRLITAKFSPRTINRKLSSLRSYVGWAKKQGLISADRSPNHTELVSASNLTVKKPACEQEILSQAQNDKKYSPFPPERLAQKSVKGINFLFDNLFILPFIRALEAAQYLLWKVTGKKIFKKTVLLQISRIIQPEEILNIKRELYAPLSISTHYLPIHKRIWHYLRHVRPNWYKQYHSYSFTHYFHFAILMILSCTIGFWAYSNVIATDTQKNSSILGASTNISPLILSFQGKLTDSSETPITKETNILFSLYESENASSEAALWQEKDMVKPDPDGSFSLLLGKKTPLPNNAFSLNSRLFLGITVGNSPELRPRQEMATVFLASNAETLQGFEPIANTNKTSNVILTLDSSGNLNIADTKTHTFQTIGGQFILSGKVLSLTTAPESNSNIEIVPDGTGKIDLSKPIQNSTNNNNLTSALGSVEFDDTVAILATTSSQAALNINQNSSGTLISASSSGIAKFAVENDGTGKFSGDLEINGGDLTSTASTFNFLSSNVTTLNIGRAAKTLNMGLLGGTTTIKSNFIVDKDFTLPSFTSNGGILYANGSGKILQASAGSSSDCLMGGTTPSFVSCPGVNIFNQTNAAVYTNNTTLDILFGGSATDSAKFAFINMNSGTPTASISGDITLNSAGTIRTTNLHPLTIGGTTTGGIALSSGSETPSLYAVNGGNVGIGTTAPLYRLDVQDSQSATAAAQIYNTSIGADADGLIIKLGFTGGGTATNFFTTYLNGNGLIQGMVKSNAASGVTYQTNGVADFAEYLKKNKDEIIEYGSVVCLKDNGLTVKCGNGNNKIIGVASERPAFLGGENLGNESIAVGLVGQVETLVAIFNGEIKAGDMLTASDISGVAVKATKAGQIIGKALEDLNIIDESKIVGYYDPDNGEYRSKTDFPNIPLKENVVHVAKIPALINVSWYDPNAYLAQNGDFIINSTVPKEYFISNSKNETLSNIEGFFEIAAARVKAGLVNVSETITNTLIVTSDSVLVNGQSLKDYIVATIKEAGFIQPEIVSPVVNTDQLFANVISPLSSPSLTVKLATPSGSLIVENASGSTVARIDDQGNASFSGQLSAATGQFEEASISGTLHAGNIFAESIEGLEAKVSSYLDLASYSAQLSNIPDLAAQRAQFSEGLMVFGPTSLADLSVIGRLSVGGTLFVTDNSIEVLGTDLSFQSLRQGGLSFMAGLVYIDTDGNVKIQGDLAVTGKLAVNTISPLPTSDLVVNNASGSGILSLDQNGNLTASGSGTFAKLNFSLIEPVLALSLTEVVASSSAGIAQIASYRAEITIRNPLITDKSVIYITPVGTPSAQTPFLMRQTPEKSTENGIEGSFTVGVESPTNHPIDFNWLIIN